jgi:intracellular multiplication protein IcmO
MANVNYRESVRRYERDTRNGFKKTGDFLARRSTGVGLLASLGFGAAILPEAADLFSLIGLGMLPLYALKKETLPMKLPTSAKRRDPHDLEPGNRRALSMSRGIFFLGKERETGLEAWLNKGDITRHLLVLGTTGSGKTEFLLAEAANAMAMGAGLIYVDAKGATDVFWRIVGLAKRFGREDDVLLMNFITGSARVEARTLERKSNTNNIFATGSADSLTQIIVGLLSGGEESGGENAVFKDRAISLMAAILRCLVDLRDAGKLPLSVRVLTDWVSNMEYLLDVVRGRFAGQPFEYSVNSRAAMQTYLNGLGGINIQKPATQQNESSMKQHGFGQSYWTKVLSDLSFTYGHIFGGGLGEIDWQDVVANRRICFVNMPSMEKPPAELQSLGRIILSGIKTAMSVSLGSGVEGERSQVIESKPSVSKAPTFVILDEYGYIATEGFAVAAAQARSLGFSITFAGQDWAGFTRGSETEAEQIKGNTFVKISMNVQDEKDTWEIFRVSAGQEVGTRLADIEPPSRSGTTKFNDSRVSVELRDRLVIQDVREQIEGEGIAQLGDQIVRLALPYVPPGGLSVDTLRLNRFLQVFPPGMLDPEEIAAVAPETILERYLKGKISLPSNLAREPDPAISTFARVMAEPIEEDLLTKSIRAFCMAVAVSEVQGGDPGGRGGGEHERKPGDYPPPPQEEALPPSAGDSIPPVSPPKTDPKPDSPKREFPAEKPSKKEEKPLSVEDMNDDDYRELLEKELLGDKKP